VLVDKVNYKWNDGDSENIAIEWIIERKVVTTPIMTSKNIWIDAEQVANFDESTLYNMSGNSATVVGTYEATFTLDNTVNCKWTDSVITTTAPWTIVIDPGLRLHGTR